MQLTKIDKELLEQISNLHGIPEGAYNIRKNGELLARNSSEDIEIISKKDKPGIDIIIHSNVQGKSVHIPVIVDKVGMNDLVYNDFYIKDGADVTIVAGCGVHNNSSVTNGHNGIHTFHIGKNCKVSYIEKHLGLGKGSGDKILNPTTNVYMKENSFFEMQTIQLGGVSYANRKTNAVLNDNAELSIKEKIFTTKNEQAVTDFKVTLKGKNSKCNLISRSVARENSNQCFKSKLIGTNECFGRVECDAILLDNARVKSIPQIDARSVNATLNHEATVGKIAGEQLVKLMTLGLTKQEAEDLIIKGYLK